MVGGRAATASPPSRAQEGRSSGGTGDSAPRVFNGSTRLVKTSWDTPGSVAGLKILYVSQ